MAMEIEFIEIKTVDNGFTISVHCIDNSEFEHAQSNQFVFLNWDEVVRFMVDPLDVIEATKAIKNGAPYVIKGDK